VAAVGGDDLVLDGQMLTHPDRDGFLPEIEVREPGDLASLDIDVQPFLKLADQLHLAIGAQERFPARLHPLSHPFVVGVSVGIVLEDHVSRALGRSWLGHRHTHSVQLP